jgi:hypothetical protein
MIDERTTQVNTRIPVDLADRAARAARQARPGLSMSGVIRLALARLAGLPDEYASPLPRTRYALRKPSQTDTT